MRHVSTAERQMRMQQAEEGALAPTRHGAACSSCTLGVRDAGGCGCEQPGELARGRAGGRRRMRRRRRVWRSSMQVRSLRGRNAVSHHAARRASKAALLTCSHRHVWATGSHARIRIRCVPCRRRSLQSPSHAQQASTCNVVCAGRGRRRASRRPLAGASRLASERGGPSHS